MQETTLSKDDERITRIVVKEETPSLRYGFEPKDEDSVAFFGLCSTIRQCGEAARTNQSHIHRSLKDDGSILTETDLAVSDAVIARIRKLYPDCNIITEEIDLHDYKEGARFTFVLDPIDGTDAYSQGLPSWCVALGILDSHRKPCGAIMYAPRFGVGEQDMFFCAMPGDSKLYLNGKEHQTPQHYDVPRQMIIGSNTMEYMDISRFHGKFRSFGSSILHMVAPVAFSNLDCTTNPYCYAWDVAAAHGIVERSGLKICYVDGSPIEYDDVLLIERKHIRMPTYVGNDGCIKWMQENIRMVNRE